MSSRGYQYGYSNQHTHVYDTQYRERKAYTMVAVLQDFLGELGSLSALNVGGSSGIIDNILANHFQSVIGVDIDADAIEYARKTYNKPNLLFQTGDAMALDHDDSSIDVIICSQVYEHVPDAGRMFKEIGRVLKPGGICYFAATNRLIWNEPHYNLPLLSVLPRVVADLYIRAAGKAGHYYELHFTCWGLRRLVAGFELIDYTSRIVENPQLFKAGYMLVPGSLKSRVAKFVVRYVYWMMPGYIWLLRKPPHEDGNSHEPQ